MSERRLNPAEASSLLVNHVLERINRRTEDRNDDPRILADPLYIHLAIHLWQPILQDATKNAVLQDTVTRALATRESESIPQDLLLTDEEARLLRIKYGLEDGQVRNQKNSAQALGISPKKVRQIEFRALGKLTDPRGWNQEFMKVRPENFPLY